MIGPVVKTDAAAARAMSGVFRALPPQVQAALLVAGLLVGMAGCSAAWIDQQDYRPSPNVCRPVDAGVPPEPAGTCVPRQQVPGPPR